MFSLGTRLRAVSTLFAIAFAFGAANADAATPSMDKAELRASLNRIDAQASKNQARAYMAVRSAAGHIHMIADPLADGIAKQFPSKFAD